MIRLRIVMVFLALAATPEVRHFRYERAIADAGSRAGQTCAALSAGVYEHAARGLADVRVYRGTGRKATETPYSIRQAAIVEPRPHTISPLNLGRKGAQTTFEAEMPDGQYSDVDLDISAKDFVTTVAVTGAHSDDGREGMELGLYTIFDLTSQKLGRSTVLHLPASNFRYLYFGIAGPVKPEDVHGLSAEPMAAKVQFVTVAATNQATQKNHETSLQFRVPAHVPVDRIEFAVGTEPKNFSRAVTIQAKPVQTPRLPSGTDAPGGYATGNLLRLHATQNGHRIDEEHLAVDAPSVDFGDGASQWTVTIDNGDDVPLNLKSVQLEMAERRLCFDAAAGSTYTLLYGDAALSAPRYDYATLFNPEADAAVATLGPEQANSDYVARPDARPFTERHPALLWIALLAVVAVLGLVAVRTARDGALKD